MDAEKLQKVVTNACRIAHKGLVDAAAPSTTGAHPPHAAVATIAAALVTQALESADEQVLKVLERFEPD